MVSWKLSLLLVVAVFFVLTLDVEATRGSRRNSISSSNGTEDGSDADGGHTGVVARRRGHGGGRRGHRNRNGTATGGTGAGHGGMGRRRGGRRRGNRRNNGGTDVGTGETGESGAGGQPRRGGRRRGNRRNPGTDGTDAGVAETRGVVQGERPGRGSRGRGGRRGGRPGRRGQGGRRGGGRRGGRGRGGRRSRPNPRLMNGYVLSTGRFGFNLYTKVAVNSTDNFVFSPLGVFTSVSLSLIGASGPTKRQIIRALNIRAPAHPASRAYNMTLIYGDNENTSLGMAMGLYTDQSVDLNQRYVRYLRGFYNMTASRFHTVDRVGNINEFVASRTNDEIPSFLMDGDVTEDDLILILHAIFFRGRWTERFETTDTELATFTNADGEEFQVDTMSRFGNFRHKQSTALGASVIEIPYQGEKFALYVILPNHDVGLADVETRLSHEVINETLSTLDAPAPFSLKLPKFTLDASHSMINPLRSLRVTQIFEPSGRLNRLTTNRDAFVKDIKHQARFVVDEDGATVSTVTEAENEFHANRPFIFVVRDHTKGINLLLGRYVDAQGDNLN